MVLISQSHRLTKILLSRKSTEMNINRVITKTMGTVQAKLDGGRTFLIKPDRDYAKNLPCLSVSGMLR
jgi:hypothetical protein